MYQSQSGLHQPLSQSVHLQPRQDHFYQRPRSDTPRHQQPVPAVTSAPFLGSSPAQPVTSQSQTQAFHPSAGQNPQVKVETPYGGALSTSFAVQGTAAHLPSSEPVDSMAVQALTRGQMYPALGNYHASSSSPTSMQSPQHDGHPRNMYGHAFSFPHSFYNYAPYSMPQHPAYAAQVGSIPTSYPPVSSATSAMLMSNQAPPMIQQHSSHGQTSPTSATPRSRPESIIDGSHGNNVQSSHTSSRSDPTTAAPGPIPATTPLVVRQDGNGVQWIAFEYSRDRVKMEYTIRCDVESVDTNSLAEDFKSLNCVYPRACTGKDSYKGNRLHYESECNTVGWALADLNPLLREKRGLIQRAVDSWRNSNQDPRLRSRRVRRMAKISTRKAQMSKTSSSGMPVTTPQSATPGPLRPHHMAPAAGQLDHQHRGYEGSIHHPTEDMSGMFHHM